MKKEIKKTNNANVYPTIKKLSLAITIIGWIALFIAVLGVIGQVALPASSDESTIELLKEISEYLIYAGGGVMGATLFLSIGEIVLAKKVQNVTPHITSKQSLIIFAVALGAGLLGGVVAAIEFVPKVDMGIYLIVSGAALALLAFLLELITATIIVAQIKVKEPAKKGK